MSSTQNYHYCLLGAICWEHPSWVGTFYPEDLPAEWRLNYYSTSFECVYLPYAIWHAAAPETLDAWQHDTQEHFRFLLQAPPAPSAENDALIAALGKKAVAVHPQLGSAHSPPLVWLEPDANLRQLAQTLQALEAAPPFYLISVSANYAQLAQARTLLEVLGY